MNTQVAAYGIGSRKSHRIKDAYKNYMGEITKGLWGYVCEEQKLEVSQWIVTQKTLSEAEEEGGEEIQVLGRMGVRKIER